MNRQQRRASSRRPPPPKEGLICRAEAMAILRKSRRTTYRYEKDGRLLVVYVDTGGTKWFDVKRVMQLAADLALEEREGHVSSGAQKVATPAPPPPVNEEDYDPGRRVRRPPRAERPAPLPPPPAPTRPPAPKAEEKPREEKPLLPSAKGATAIRTTTLVDPNWFNEDLDLKNGKGGPGKGGSE